VTGRHVEPNLVREIETIVEDRGHLTRDEISEMFGFDDESYAALKATLISRRKVQPGPPRIGGFVVREKRSVAGTEDGPGADLLREGWEEAVVARLVELLSLKQLEELLGSLRLAVRRVRFVREGVDRPVRKDELATALVLQHGIDLFVCGPVREAVGQACGVTSPARWHAGKNAAIEFVEAVRMPRELIGLPREESLPSFEYLEGRFRLRQLEDFQVEVSEKLKMGLLEPGHRSIVALPTGAGKTRVAVQAIRDWLTSRYDPERSVTPQASVLWLAHTEELCEQAYSCFRQVWEASENVAPLLLVRFWGSYTQDLNAHRPTLARILESPSVLVSTPQRMVNVLAGSRPGATTMADDLRQALGLLVIDEAHRAAAPSYRRVINGLLGEGRATPVVGLTATPFRREYVEDDPEGGTEELRSIFLNLIEPTTTLGDNIRATLQERGILARPVFSTIVTGTPMRMPPLEFDLPTAEDVERIDRDLAARADNPRRRLVLLDHIAPLAEDPRNLILYFGPSVSDAECMAYLLRERQIPAAVVSGQTREATRRRIIDRFKRSELRVLCNCEVLTTGFDAPKVSHVVMARPTVSQVLYEQIVGRGLRGRVFGGTDTCVILDCQDDFGNTLVRPELGYRRFRRIWKAEVAATKASNKT
jgi:superfamily II DNA or RNA helicase